MITLLCEQRLLFDSGNAWNKNRASSITIFYISSSNLMVFARQRGAPGAGTFDEGPGRRRRRPRQRAERFLVQAGDAGVSSVPSRHHNPPLRGLPAGAAVLRQHE